MSKFARPGPEKKRRLRSSWSSERVFVKLETVEIWPVARIVIQIQRAAQIVGFVHAEIVDAIWLGPEKRVIAEVDQGNRQAAMLKCVMPESSQPCVHAVGNAKQRFERKLIAVADDEIVLHIK